MKKLNIASVHKNSSVRLLSRTWSRSWLKEASHLESGSWCLGGRRSMKSGAAEELKTGLPKIALFCAQPPLAACFWPDYGAFKRCLTLHICCFLPLSRSFSPHPPVCQTRAACVFRCFKLSCISTKVSPSLKEVQSSFLRDSSTFLRLWVSHVQTFLALKQPNRCSVLSRRFLICHIFLFLQSES